MKHLSAAFSIRLLAICFTCFTIAGCRVIDPAEEIPSYIHIDAINLTTSYQAEGTASHEISDAWIFVDGELIGGFELPCTVPVLYEGSHRILIRAGIKQNGQGATRAIYPFYKGYETTVELTRAQTTTISPTVTYFPAVQFIWMEDFDQPGQSLVPDLTGQIDSAVGADAFEGIRSGYIHLNADTFSFLGRSSVPFTGLTASTENYLEFNYKSNEYFSIGIIGPSNDFHEWAVASPSSDWNKLYIRLSDVLAELPANSSVKVYFAMLRTASTVDRPELYLDNIKLVK
jgi:hypothetical protein